MSVLTFYFYKHDFNLWVIGISGFFALAQFPAIFEEKKKSKVSAEKNLILDKNIPRTIERSLSLLALPVVGQIVGVYLISKLMLAAIGILEVKKEKLLLPAPTK